MYMYMYVPDAEKGERTLMMMMMISTIGRGATPPLYSVQCTSIHFSTASGVGVGACFSLRKYVTDRGSCSCTVLEFVPVLELVPALAPVLHEYKYTAYMPLP